MFSSSWTTKLCFDLIDIRRVYREGYGLVCDVGQTKASRGRIPVWTWATSYHGCAFGGCGLLAWPGKPLSRLSLSIPNTLACQAKRSSFCSAPDTFRRWSREATATKAFISPCLSCCSAGLLGPALDSIKSQAQMTEAEFRALLDGSWDSSCQPEASQRSWACRDLEGVRGGRRWCCAELPDPVLSSIYNFPW